MKQKLQDLTLLIKQEKKYQVILALVVMGLLYLFLSSEPEQPRVAKQAPQKDNSRAVNREAFDDLMVAMRGDLDSVKSGVQQNSKDITEMKDTEEKDRARVAEIFKKMLDRLADVQSANMNRGSSGGAQMLPEGAADNGNGGGAVPGVAGGSGDSQAGPELASFGGGDTTVAPPAPPPPKKIAVIGPGDSVRIKLLAGVNAPTDGTPYPVVFKLIDDVRGPDSSSLPLGEARLVAAAQGSLTDQRALFRLTTLNIRMPDGRKKVLPVDGWVVGEDGIRGMEGLLIDPIGKAIAGTAEAGFISGIGQGFSQSQTTTTTGFLGNGNTTTLTGSPLIYAAGSGASGAANAMSRIISERIGQLVPHVQVYSGREGTAVFSQSVNITDLFETLQDGEVSYASSVD